MQVSDVFVSASTNEGFSNSCLEAASTGLICIAREGTPGNSKIIVDGETGILYNSSKGINLGKSMRLIQNNFDLRESMKNESIRFIRSNYSPIIAANSYNALYTELLLKMNI